MAKYYCEDCHEEIEEEDPLGIAAHIIYYHADFYMEDAERWAKRRMKIKAAKEREKLANWNKACKGGNKE